MGRMTTLEQAAIEWAAALDERWDQRRQFPYEPDEHTRIVNRLHNAQMALYKLASELNGKHKVVGSD